MYQILMLRFIFNSIRHTLLSILANCLPQIKPVKKTDHDRDAVDFDYAMID